MTYTVKEMYYTLQGEGANTGRPAVFCRFAGCNLWTGREEDREEGDDEEEDLEEEDDEEDWLEFLLEFLLELR